MVLALLATLACVAGYLLFPTVPLIQQQGLAQFLATTAATLFAILGVWIAVLDPKTLLDSPVTASPPDSRSLSVQLFRPWLYATSVFAIAVIHAFVLGAGASLWDGNRAIQQVSGALLVFSLLLLLNTLLGTLLPVAHLQRKERERRIRAEYRL